MAGEAPDTGGVHIHLIHSLDILRTKAQPDTHRWIVCPWLNAFSKDSDIWVSVLAAHDANGALFDGLSASRKGRPNVYAGVFAVDPFRSANEIIRHIKRSGVSGVINFPSISFIDGAAGAAFARLSFDVDRELEFLTSCAAANLRVAGVVRTEAAAQRLLDINADFLVAHGGPPTSANRDPSIEAARRIAESTQQRKVPIVPMSAIIREQARRLTRTT